MNGLMYICLSKLICHIGEKIVKSTFYLMILSHSTSICCICLLVFKSTSDVVLTTKCCIQQTAVLWLKYILFAVVFTSVSPIWQIDVVELKYIKSVIKSTAD